MQLLDTLCVTLPESYIRLDNDTLRVQVGDETKLRVPLHHLQALVCFGHVNLSAPLMHRLADEAIALVLLDVNGRFKARLEGAVSGNVLLRQAQHRAVDNAAFTLELARALVAGKLKNQRQVLLRGAREAKLPDEEARLMRASQNLAASLRAQPQAAPGSHECLAVLPLRDVDERLPLCLRGGRAEPPVRPSACRPPRQGGARARLVGGVSPGGRPAGTDAGQPWATAQRRLRVA